MEVIVESGHFQKNEATARIGKPTSDIRFINDFKRYLSSNPNNDTDLKRFVDDSINKENINSLIKPTTIIEYESSRSITNIINSAAKQPYTAQVGNTYAVHKEVVQATFQNFKNSENKVDKEIDRTQFRNLIPQKKPVDQEIGVKFSLLGNGKSILAIRSYRSNSEELLNWVASKFGYSLDTIIINGKKILTKFGNK